MRNSSIVKEDKLLIMNGVGLSLKKEDSLAESYRLQDQSKSKYAELASNIETELDGSLF